MHLEGRWKVLHIPPWSEADNCPGKVAGQVPRVQGFRHGLSRGTIVISLFHCHVATDTLANTQNESQITTVRVMVLTATLWKPWVFSVDNHLHLVVHLQWN